MADLRLAVEDALRGGTCDGLVQNLVAVRNVVVEVGVVRGLLLHPLEGIQRATHTRGLSTHTKAKPDTAMVAIQTSELAGDHAGYNSLNDLLRAADAVFSG
jgi:hypothetical protein